MSPADEERRARFLGGWRPTYPFTVTTLRDHIYVRDAVHVTCPECRHTSVLPLLELAARHGSDVTLDAVLRALRCVCGRLGKPELTLVYDSPPAPPRQRP